MKCGLVAKIQFMYIIIRTYNCIMSISMDLGRSPRNVLDDFQVQKVFVYVGCWKGRLRENADESLTWGGSEILGFADRGGGCYFQQKKSLT